MKESKNKKNKYGSFLDRIIDKYSATPRFDPELINYTSRPTRDSIRERQIDEVARRSTTSENSRLSEQVL